MLLALFLRRNSWIGSIASLAHQPQGDTMKKTLLASAIALAFGATGSAWADSSTKIDKAKGDVTQTATTNSTQTGNSAPTANDSSTAKQWNDSSTNTKTDSSNNSKSNSSNN